MTQESLKITSLDELKAVKQGTIVALPPFAENRPFVAKISRPSMMVLVKEGKIPNRLLAQASKLFAGNATVNPQKPEEMSHVADVLDIIARASFVEPTYEELESAGVQLTDEQLIFIFNYSQAGVSYLESFRKK